MLTIITILILIAISVAKHIYRQKLEDEKERNAKRIGKAFRGLVSLLQSNDKMGMLQWRQRLDNGNRLKWLFRNRWDKNEKFYYGVFVYLGMENGAKHVKLTWFYSDGFKPGQDNIPMRECLSFIDYVLNAVFTSTDNIPSVTFVTTQKSIAESCKLLSPYDVKADADGRYGISWKQEEWTPEGGFEYDGKNIYGKLSIPHMQLIDRAYPKEGVKKNKPKLLENKQPVDGILNMSVIKYAVLGGILAAVQ